ncbi:hypothetical protein Hte_012512 [Hypoxylon texense]
MYYFSSEKLYSYDAIRIIRKELLDKMKAILQERHILIHYDSKLVTITSDNPDEVEFTFTDSQTKSAPLIIGVNRINSTIRGIFLPQVKPIYTGFMGINSVVQRSQLRIPEGYSLPATVMAQSGAFLLVPQKPDSSELFIGSQQQFPTLDAAGWEALRKDKQKLYDMLQENKDDWPDVAFHSIPPLASWLSDSKRIILIRDTAHAIPPTAGQGANQAFEDARALATLLSELSPEVPLDGAAAKWQAFRQDRIKKVLDLTRQMNVKRLPESERAKMPPGAIWTDQSLTRGEGGELRWLYDPDLAEEAKKWVEELKQAS